MNVRAIAPRRDSIYRPPASLPLFIVRLMQVLFSRELQCYFLASAAALGVDIGVMVLTKETLGVHYLAAAALGFLTGLVTAYVLSIRWVFWHRRQTDWRREFPLFAATGLCGLSLNHGIMWAGTDGLGLDYTLSKVISAACVFLINFLLRKLLLFSPTEKIA